MLQVFILFLLNLGQKIFIGSQGAVCIFQHPVRVLVVLNIRTVFPGHYHPGKSSQHQQAHYSILFHWSPSIYSFVSGTSRNHNRRTPEIFVRYTIRTGKHNTIRTDNHRIAYIRCIQFYSDPSTGSSVTIQCLPMYSMEGLPFSSTYL